MRPSSGALTAMAVAMLLTFVTLGHAQQSTMSSVQLLSNATTTATGEKHSPRCVNRTFQAMGTTSSGSGASAIVIEASDTATPEESTNVDWTTLATISLTLGTTQTNDGFVSAASWRWVRARVSSISGTGASVNAYMGCG